MMPSTRVNATFFLFFLRGAPLELAAYWQRGWPFGKNIIRPTHCVSERNRSFDIHALNIDCLKRLTYTGVLDVVSNDPARLIETSALPGDPEIIPSEGNETKQEIVTMQVMRFEWFLIISLAVVDAHKVHVAESKGVHNVATLCS